MTLVGVNKHVRPEGVEGGTDRLTAPVKPDWAVSVMVEEPEVPALVLTVFALD